MSSSGTIPDSNAAGGTADLSLCAQEPIHIPGSIQPHGVLFALAQNPLRVVQASANTRELLGIPAESILNQGLEAIFDAGQAAAMTKQVESLTAGEPVYLGNLSIGNGGSEPEARSFAVTAHRSGESIIVEMELTESRGEVSFSNLYPLVQSFLSRSKATLRLEELAQLSADQVRWLTGFDRVLLYKFDAGWNGHVIAESKVENYPSYLDLWFPASDIPEQARKLYTLNRFRSIVDAAYRPVPIVPALNPLTQAPLDLSYSYLRSVSPVHIEYLKNMDVVASMSISILTRDSRLWGLIACHHRSPKQVPIEARPPAIFWRRRFRYNCRPAKNPLSTGNGSTSPRERHSCWKRWRGRKTSSTGSCRIRRNCWVTCRRADARCSKERKPHYWGKRQTRMR